MDGLGLSTPSLVVYALVYLKYVSRMADSNEKKTSIGAALYTHSTIYLGSEN